MGNNMRCRHTDAVIAEHTSATLHFFIDNDEVTGDWAAAAEPTGAYTVTCNECGLEKTYRLPINTWPKWARRFYRLMREYSE